MRLKPLARKRLGGVLAIIVLVACTKLVRLGAAHMAARSTPPMSSLAAAEATRPTTPHRVSQNNLFVQMQKRFDWPDPGSFTRTEPPADSTPATPMAVPQCARWPAHIRDRVNERCGAWASYFGEWLVLPTEQQGSVVYTCDANCTGLGDRLVGIVGALNVAMYEGRALRVRLPALGLAFEPCALGTDYAARWNASVDHERHPACKTQHSYMRDAITCQLFATAGDACSFTRSAARELVNVNRPCIRPRICNALRRAWNAGLTEADIVGCPLRLLMEPGEAFSTLHTFQFRIEGRVSAMTLREIVATLSRFYVIAVHVRSPDQEAHVRIADESEWQLPLDCARLLETHVRASGGEPRPVRWLVLTNNVDLHARLANLVGDRLLQFAHQPAHVQAMTSRAQELALLAEWIVVGVADKHVLADFANGRRPSALAVTALLYNLRSTWVRASTCTEEPLPAFNTNLDVECRSAWSDDWEPGSRPPNAPKQTSQRLPQPHLAHRRISRF